MNKNYIFLAIVMIGLAAGLLVLPEKENYVQIAPEDLMWDAVQPTKYFTVDQVAAMIIDGDPTIELIDVRSVKDYDAFSLKNAINIPLDSLLSPNYEGYLGIEDMNVVFYANDNIKADQARIIGRRMGYKNLYIMQGGLNSWIDCIINPQKPSEDNPLTAFEQYEFRKGASIYFTGSQLETSDNKASVKVVRRKKATAVAGGC
jgi:rhodanese-related sulfurtransferase